MKKLSFGMPTLAEMPDLEASIFLCRRLGLDFIELNMNLPLYQHDKLDIASLKVVKGVYFTLHLDEDLNPADFNSKVAAAWLDTALSAISAAREIKAPVINMHMQPGVYFTLPDRKLYLFDEYKNHFLDSFLNFREKCEKAVGKSQTKICMENTGGYLPFMCEALELLLESPVFALTLDIGHSHGAGGVDEAFIARHANRLRHMHIHDAIAKANHLVLGEGEINLKQKLDMAESHGCRCVIEVKTAEGLEKSVSYIRRLDKVYS